MAKKPKSEPENKEQSERFVETARKLRADETGKAFREAIKKIAPKNKRSK